MTMFFKILVVLIFIAGTLVALCLPGGDRVMGSYLTSLEQRTRGQRINATLAARALDGVRIAPGAVFSFNQAVGAWSPDRGYVRAPVSFDGELAVDWGGGVCQTSTTLYNAALLAGLSVVQRNRHTWAPSYVPPGRDAAVAQGDIDLQLRNPYPRTVRIRAQVSADQIGLSILGQESGPMASVTNVIQSQSAPREMVKTDDRLPHGARRMLNRGHPGVRAAVYRTFVHGPFAGRRELVSLDSYPTMERLVAVGR
jgi:vancomycin resistance protein YoaR